MKTVSVIKAATKAGLLVYGNSGRIEVKSDFVNGSFFDQNGEAVGLRTIRKEDEKDHKPEYDERRDSFHYSMKGFIQAFSY
jgi:hypothetical protein